jgi:hypothetical protein
VQIHDGPVLVAAATLIAGSATIAVDSSKLSNGPVALETRILSASGEILASTTASYFVFHPEAVVVETVLEEGILHATIALSSPTAAGLTSHYAVLATQSTGDGEFPAFGMHLALPPSATELVASGFFDVAADGTALLPIAVAAPSNLSAEFPLRLCILLQVDGEWRTTGEITIAP